MNESLTRWLFERKALFAVIALGCITGLCAAGQISDGVYAGCFTALVAAFLTAAVVSEKNSAN